MLSIGFKNTTELSAYFRRPNFFSLPDLADALKSSSPLGPAHAGAPLSSNPRRVGSVAGSHARAEDPPPILVTELCDGPRPAGALH